LDTRIKSTYTLNGDLREKGGDFKGGGQRKRSRCYMPSTSLKELEKKKKKKKNTLLTPLEGELKKKRIKPGEILKHWF